MVDDFREKYPSLSQRQRERFHALLEKVSRSYSDDPGTGDLDDDQPVGLSITLGEVRLVRQLVPNPDRVRYCDQCHDYHKVEACSGASAQTQAV